MEVTLKISTPWTPSRKVVAHRSPLLIGRHLDADVSLAGDRWVSRWHCEIVKSGGRHRLRDLGSRHHTLLNGSLVDEEELENGDVIQVGLTRLEVSFVDTPVDEDCCRRA